jgi:DNA-binding IclR family transcriptional regulator
MFATSTPETRMLERIRAEYEESPGLSLTSRQAQRLWGLDPGLCSRLLNELVRQRFLRRTASDTYIRVNPDR